MKFSELCGRQVINVKTGCLIGLVNDVGFDAYSYQVKLIYVRPAAKFVKKLLPWFFPCEEIEIPIDEIENICGDVILVRFR